jgi:hypothetical protein
MGIYALYLPSILPPLLAPCNKPPTAHLLEHPSMVPRSSILGHHHRPALERAGDQSPCPSCLTEWADGLHKKLLQPFHPSTFTLVTDGSLLPSMPRTLYRRIRYKRGVHTTLVTRRRRARASFVHSSFVDTD